MAEHEELYEQELEELVGEESIALDSELSFTADDELDLEGEGFQACRMNLLVKDAEVQEKENGTLAVVVLENDELRFPIRITFWMRHGNPQAQQIGRSGLKRLFQAAFGVPKGSLSALRGLWVSGWVREDDSGRLTASSFRKAEGVEAEVPVLM